LISPLFPSCLVFLTLRLRVVKPLSCVRAEVLVDVHLSAIYRELVAVHASSDDERATLAIECLLLIDRIIPEPELLLKMIATCDPPHPQVRWGNVGVTFMLHAVLGRLDFYQC
jgi:hypothetical protein